MSGGIRAFRTRRRRSPTTAKGRQAGYTLVETAIAMAVMAVVLQALLMATLALSRSSQLGERRLDQARQGDLALRSVADELALTSTDTDPDTGLPYLTITDNGQADSISFRRINGVSGATGEVVPVWSTPIEFLLDQERLVRRQDGADQVILESATTLEIELDDSDRIVLRVGLNSDQDQVGAHATTRELLVLPQS